MALTHQEIQQLKKIEGTHYMQPAYMQPSLKRWNEFIQSTKSGLKQAVQESFNHMFSNLVVHVFHGNKEPRNKELGNKELGNKELRNFG